MTVFFDTNIIAYMFDDSQPVKQHRAFEIFSQSAPDAVISTQVQIELCSVLTRKLGKSREDAARVLRELRLDVVPTDGTLVLAAADAAARHQLSIFDALVLVAAGRGRCSELWTEDLATGSTLDGIRIVNPFLPV